MSDGTDTLSGGNDVQPGTPDTSNAPVEQVDGASNAPESPENQGWQAPEGFDEHLGKALSKLPAEQREVFLALEPSGLDNVRDLVLKGVDYTQKRQKEAAELRDMQAKMAEMETRAKAWAEAEADPERASRLFGAMAGGVDTQAKPEPQVEFNDIWDATDPDEARAKAESWANGLKQSIREELRQEQQNSPAAKQQAMQVAVGQIRTSLASGLDDQGWNRALQAVQNTLDRERVNYLDLTPQQLRLAMSPAIEYELKAASTRVAGLNPATLTGNQATSLRGSGSSPKPTHYQKPPDSATTEEKIAWFMKSKGYTSESQLYG